MKTISLVSVVLLLALCFGSCASTATQETINAAFEKVYAEYRSDLIMDGAKEYTVKSGDTLSRIAISNFGSGHGFYFPVIMLASKGIVSDPDLIEPGMILTIPDLERNLNDSTARSRIKSFLLDISDVYRKKNNAEVQNQLIKLSNSL